MKKILFILLILSTFLFFAENAYSQAYNDLDDNHWAFEKINLLTQDGVLSGYPDGTFRPNEQVTRAEFATMVIKGLNQQNSKINEIIKFKDLPEKHWAYKTVEQAANFDLIKGTPEGYFYPQEPVTRAHTISVAINALDVRKISENKAREVLKKFYDDYDLIPNWIIINAGKAEILDMNVKVPNSEHLFRANEPATRAEAAVAVYNMVREARLNPNKKLATAMQPRTAEGIVIEEAEYNGKQITIPAGTMLPVVMINAISSQTNQIGELFLAKIPQNYVTAEKYLIIAENSPIAGQILEVKRGKYFVRNAKIVMETKTVRTIDKENELEFNGIVDTKIKRKFWAKLGRTIFKGYKINIKDEIIYVELLKPLIVNVR